MKNYLIYIKDCILNNDLNSHYYYLIIMIKQSLNSNIKHITNNIVIQTCITILIGNIYLY